MFAGDREELLGCNQWLVEDPFVKCFHDLPDLVGLMLQSIWIRWYYCSLDA